VQIIEGINYIKIGELKIMVKAKLTYYDKESNELKDMEV
jgi:hypothetical protein